MTIPPFCPEPSCRFHSQDHPNIKWFRTAGSYYTKAFRTVRRYLCLHCGKWFSDQTFSLDYFVRSMSTGTLSSIEENRRSKLTFMIWVSSRKIKKRNQNRSTTPWTTGWAVSPGQEWAEWISYSSATLAIERLFSIISLNISTFFSGLIRFLCIATFPSLLKHIAPAYLFQCSCLSISRWTSTYHNNLSF